MKSHFVHIADICAINPAYSVYDIIPGIGFIGILLYIPFSYFLFRKYIATDNFHPHVLYKKIKARVLYLGILIGFLCFVGGQNQINWHNAWFCNSKDNGENTAYALLLILVGLIVIYALFLRNYFRTERANHYKSIRVYFLGIFVLLAFFMLGPPPLIAKYYEVIGF